MAYSKSLLIFAIISSLFYRLTSSIGIEEFTRIRRVMNAAKVLRHGDSCSWEAEQARQNFTKEFFSGNVEAALKITNDFETRGDKLCDDRELYVCDRESAKCVCGEQGYEALIGVNRTLFALEGSGRCRWEAGAYCIPEEFKRWPTTPEAHSMCKTGTSCLAIDGSLCTRQWMIEFIRNITGVEYRVIMQQFMARRICSCMSS